MGGYKIRLIKRDLDCSLEIGCTLRKQITTQAASARSQTGLREGHSPADMEWEEVFMNGEKAFLFHVRGKEERTFMRKDLSEEERP